MIWLASFPRSGNTFFRNVLKSVYGISSSEYHNLPELDLDPNFGTFPVVKTHLLPHQLPMQLRESKSVYIIRDGRDAIVSLAHYRKDLIAPNSKYYINLLEAILAREGSFFGGWSENVRLWTAKADVIIRFEDLIENPIKEIEKLRSIINLPDPKNDKIPSFELSKRGLAPYGVNIPKMKKNEEKVTLSKKFFRRGKVGSYKDEMPLPFRILFWLKNSTQMKAHGYYK